MRSVIVKDDTTTTGGTVLEGVTNMRIQGKPVALVGMLVSCPVCQQGQGNIVAVGERQGKINGVSIALENDYVECGCPVMTNKLLSNQDMGRFQ